MRRMVLLLTISLCLAFPAPGSADTTAQHARYVLSITTSPDSGWISIDGLLAGRAPLRIDTLSAGVHIVHVAHPDFSNWLTEAADDTIIMRQDTTIHYLLAHWYSIITVPVGATVFAGDSALGQTPLLLGPDRIPSDSTLTLRKNGFGEATTSLALAARGVLIIPLIPTGQPSEASDWRLAASPAARRNTLPLWIAGGSAVVFGGFSAYYKLAADDQQQAFLSTGNPYNAAERTRLDNLAALYFVAAQIGLGVFVAYLLSE